MNRRNYYGICLVTCVVLAMAFIVLLAIMETAK
ncbi:MAG: hypothetical protein Pg6C_18330 [Treponemataceae bacterium]|nr:MAG: hypothetical protein Pg6C_18330 [Treponemataceae bacterium]